MSLRELPAPGEMTSAGVGFVDNLAQFGDAPAVIVNGRTISYAELDQRVIRSAAQLGTERTLVMMTASNTLESLVWYLGALRAKMPVLLLPKNEKNDSSGHGQQDSQQYAALIDTHRPGIVIDAQQQLTRLTNGVRSRDLHPQLCLLMSTSGSTGAAKLVRLSQTNVTANTDAIASYLGLTAADRAITTLPMGYCYGLSVINSHLAVGASIVLTELSVVDPCFWRLFTATQPTGLAGVPFTFELLEQVDLTRRDVDCLRYITAAGGRLSPERVRRFGQLGIAQGWQLFVMYGQTEATARMAYLPPDEVLRAPAAIGRPIPGGQLEIAALPAVEDDVDGLGPVGELVYRGPNVMLGYATDWRDLALGRTVSELRTGDLARQRPDGLYEIVGRRADFAKVCGKRVDLQHVARIVEAEGYQAACVLLTSLQARSFTGRPVAWEGERIVVATTTRRAEPLRELAATCAGIPPSAIVVVSLDNIPRGASGKVDAVSIRRLAADQVASDLATERAAHPVSPADRSSDPLPRRSVVAAVTDLYASAFRRSQVSETDSFVSLGGDSMTYIEMSVRLERILGDLPDGWHMRPIVELAAVASKDTSGELAAEASSANEEHADIGRQLPVGPRTGRSHAAGADTTPSHTARRGSVRVETNVLLRALAVVLIVGSHVTLFDIRGGAHLLIAIAGYNFARFQLSLAPTPQRLRQMLCSVRRVVVPSMVWMAFAVWLDAQYSWANVFFAHNVASPDPSNPAWRYWFVEALVYVLLFAIALVTLPYLRDLQRRWPFGFAIGLVCGAMVIRFLTVDPALDSKTIFTPWAVLVVFALGWALSQARTTNQRVLVVLLAAVALVGYSENFTRVSVVWLGILVLAFLPVVRVPWLLMRVAVPIATASLYIYLTHWQVYPLFGEYKLLALAGSLLAGIGLAAATTRIGSWLRARTLPRSATRPATPLATRPTARPAARTTARPADGVDRPADTSPVRVNLGNRDETTGRDLQSSLV